MSIPLGIFGRPISAYGTDNFNLSVRNPSPSNVISLLNATQAAGESVILSLSDGRTSPTNWSMTQWMQGLYAYVAAGIDFTPYILDGTLFAQELADEIFEILTPTVFTFCDCMDMVNYSRSLFPTMPTAFRCPPSYFQSLNTNNLPWTGLDYAWSQVSPVAYPNPRTYFQGEVTIAGTQGLKVIAGTNLEEGGTSGRPGYTPGRFNQTAAQVVTNATEMLTGVNPETDVVAHIFWKYDTQYLDDTITPGITAATATARGLCNAHL